MTRFSFAILCLLAGVGTPLAAVAGDGTAIRTVIGTGEGSERICSGDAFVWCNPGGAREDAEEEAREAARTNAEEKCRERDDYLAVVSVTDSATPPICGQYQPWGQPPRIRCTARATARCEVRVPEIHVSGRDSGSHSGSSWDNGGLLGDGGIYGSGAY